MLFNSKFINKGKKIILFSIAILIAVLVVFFLVFNYLPGHKSLHFIKNVFSKEQKQIIKKYIFPYRLISQQEKTIARKEKGNF